MNTLTGLSRLVTIALIAAGLVVPALADQEGEHEGEHQHGEQQEGEHEGEHEGEQVKTTSYLTSPGASTEVSATGKVKMKKQGKIQQFLVEADNLDLSAHAYTLYMEDSEHSDFFIMVYLMTACGSKGAKLKIHTGKGQVLPMSVEDLSDLSGRAVQVRDETGLICLEGYAPPTKGGLKSKSAKKSLKGSCGTGKVRLESKPKSGKHSFELKLCGQEPGSECILLVEDPTSGHMVEVASVPIDGFGKGLYRVASKKGQSLPCGVPDPKLLSGSKLEVRNGVEAPVLLDAVVPKLK